MIYELTTGKNVERSGCELYEILLCRYSQLKKKPRKTSIKKVASDPSIMHSETHTAATFTPTTHPNKKKT
jgi:hypothetical protein